MFSETNHSPIEKPENEKPIKVSKIHLLFHPGYITDPNSDEMVQRFYPQEPESVSKEDLDDYAILSKKYTQQAEEVKKHPNEIMAIFTHKTGKLFRKEYKEPKDYEHASLYTQIIEDLKNILGKRLIVLSDDFNIVRDPKNDVDALEIAKRAWQRIVKIAIAKNFAIDASVEKDAYGEYLEHCVLYGLSNLNMANQLSGKTTIRPKLTEIGVNKNLMDMPGANQLAQKIKKHNDDPGLKNADFKF